MTKVNTPSLAIVIASCDKYSDLWEPLFGEFFRYWQDCPFPIYLVANHERYPDPRVTTLLAGDDFDWSTTILCSLKNVQDSHVLFWIDDAFLAGKVNNFEVVGCYKFMVDNDIDFLRLRSDPKPNRFLKNGYGRISEGAMYRVSLFATIWKTDTLRRIIKEGESAWEFELKGSERSNEYPRFYSVRKDVFRYVHGVVKGKWIRSAHKKMFRKGYLIKNKREIMSFSENIKQFTGHFRMWVFHGIPEKHRKKSLKMVQMIYKLFRYGK